MQLLFAEFARCDGFQVCCYRRQKPAGLAGRSDEDLIRAEGRGGLFRLPELILEQIHLLMQS